MTTFGEITEPSSRATWEDWDDLNNESHLSLLQWHIPLVVPEEVNKFFLLEGKYLWDSTLMVTKKEIVRVNYVKEINLRLCMIPESNNYICIIPVYDLMLSSDIVNLIKDFIVKAKMIITVQIKPMSDYITTKAVQSCIIRKIVTANCTHLMKVDSPKLEQPNIISGAAAGVFTLREHLCLSATAVVIYMDYSQDYVTEDIESLLKELDLSITGRIKSNTILSSNLYI